MSAPSCPSCGASIGEPRRFCPECGAALAPATPPRDDSRLLWLILGSIGCLGGLMLVACAGLMLLTLRSGISSARAKPTAEPTATVTAPTSPTAQPPSGASGVIVYEDFADPRASALTAEEDKTSRSAFEDGAYVIEVKNSDTLAWAVTDRSYSDIAIEAQASAAASAKVVAAGLIFHYQDNQNFYLFSVSSDGYYALELMRGAEWETLIDWTESDAISATRNTLRVETKGDRITLKVNGELLETTQDNTLVRGDAGLAVSSFATSQVMIRFDNLLITRSP
jgi:hypothetical protein